MNRIPRRVLAIAVIWLVIIVFTPLRQTTLRHLESCSWPFTLIFESEERLNSFHTLAEKNPRDPRFWVLAADGDYYVWERSDWRDKELAFQKVNAVSPLFPGDPLPDYRQERRRCLQIVVDKFPNDLWLLSRLLRLGMEEMSGDRIGGELDDALLGARPTAAKASPERNADLVNCKPDEILRMSKLCERGRRLEPENAFFDWALTHFLLYERRDQEAWRVLQAASKKKKWNSRCLDELRMWIDTTTVSKNRQLCWEEKYHINYSLGFWISHQSHTVMKIVAWECIKAKREGRHDFSLSVLRDLARLGTLIRDQSKFIAEAHLGTEMQTRAFKAPVWDIDLKRMTRPPYPPEDVVEIAREFGAYTHRYKHDELAQWAIREAYQTKLFNKMMEERPAGADLEDTQVLWLGFTDGLQRMLLLLIFGCGVGYFFLRLLIHLPAFKKWGDFSLPHPAVTGREIGLGALATVGILQLAQVLAPVVALVGVLCAIYTVGGTLVGEPALGWNGLRSIVEGIFKSFLPQDVDGMLPRLSFSNYFGDEWDQNHHFRIGLAYLPLVLGALYCMKRMVRFQAPAKRKLQLKKIYDNIRGAWRTALSGRYLTHGHDYDVASAFLKFLRGTFRFLSLPVLGLCWYVYTYGGNFGFPEALAAPAIAFFVCAGVLADVFFLWWRGRRRRSALHFGVKLLCESWLGWCALGSFLYLAALLAALPTRAHADAVFEDLLKTGEIGNWTLMRSNENP